MLLTKIDVERVVACKIGCIQKCLQQKVQKRVVIKKLMLTILFNTYQAGISESLISWGEGQMARKKNSFFAKAALVN